MLCDQLKPGKQVLSFTDLEKEVNSLETLAQKFPGQFPQETMEAKRRELFVKYGVVSAAPTPEDGPSKKKLKKKIEMTKSPLHPSSYLPLLAFSQVKSSASSP